ncbi:Retrovirus-related Pol polyprotein from type-2 retrotransposable element R2DM, partial [Dictyocoela muelleri]
IIYFIIIIIFGSTEKKNQEQSKLVKTHSKDTENDQQHKNETEKDVKHTPSTKNTISTDSVCTCNKQNKKIKNTSTTLSIINNNKNYNRNTSNNDEYFNLGKEALTIFYKHTHGNERASPSQWSQIYNEYISKSTRHISLKSFKNYFGKTRKLYSNKDFITNKIFKTENDKQKIKNGLPESINTEKNVTQLKTTSDNDNLLTDWESSDKTGETFKKRGENDKISNTNKTILEKQNCLLDNQKNIRENNTHDKTKVSQESQIIDRKQNTRKQKHIFIRQMSPQEISNIQITYKSTLNDVKSKKEVREQKCYKIPNEKIDWSIINQINEIINQIIANKNDIDHIEITNMFMSAQITYKKLTTKDKSFKNNKNYIITDKINLINSQLKYLSTIRKNFDCLDKKNILFKDITSKYGKINTIDDLNAIEYKIKNIYCLLNKKFKCDQDYKEYKKNNYKFELNRRAFYDSLKSQDNTQSTKKELNAIEVFNYWTNILSKPVENKAKLNKLDEYYKIKNDEIIESEKITIYQEELDTIISKLSIWKAAGPDGIFNFWIKNITALHMPLLTLFISFMENPEKIPHSFFHGRTILLPKEDGSSPDKLRPITCQSNIYKIYTRLLKNRLLNHIQNNNIISINQAGSVPYIHAAKEQFLINKSIVKHTDKRIKVAYIDVKKAYDSVNRNFLIDLLTRIKAPPEIINFIKEADKHWSSALEYKGTGIGLLKFNRGIPQGDSLSPLLFTIIMEYLTKSLNKNDIPPIHIDIDNAKVNLNHLLYIDDIKLYAEKENELDKLLLQTKRSLGEIGLELNLSKCASNTNAIIENQNIKTDSYKYLGIIENLTKNEHNINLDLIEKEILKRVESVLKCKLSSRNKVTAINEYAVSVLNYFVGLIEIDKSFCKELDKKIRKLMIELKFHFYDASIERLYLPRKQNGRGVKSTVDHVEVLSYNLSKYISEKNTVRKKIIIKCIESTPDSKILHYENHVYKKYKLIGNENTNDLKNIQIENLMIKLKEKALHGSFFKKIIEHGYSIKSNNEWILYGNQTASAEAFSFLLQDRYFSSFYNAGKCKFCKKSNISVDHIATRCGSLLHSSYIRRHNEVVKSIHLRIINKYGISSRKKLKNHKIEKVVKNNNAEIITEIPVRTDSNIINNKPDIIIFDNQKNIIYIIEIGVTSIENLKKYEVEKLHKYRLLGKEMEQMYGKRVIIAPYVLTWDGVTTEYNKKYRKIIDIDDRLHAYIQGVCLKMTSEIVDLCLNELSDESKKGEAGGKDVYEKGVKDRRLCE